ncbi:hypothetical protein D3C87_2030550 [compost metagenome]
MTREVSVATFEQKKVTEQVSSVVEEVNRMSHDLQGHAQALQTAIAFFHEGAPDAASLVVIPQATFPAR